MPLSSPHRSPSSPPPPAMRGDGRRTIRRRSVRSLATLAVVGMVSGMAVSGVASAAPQNDPVAAARSAVASTSTARVAAEARLARIQRRKSELTTQLSGLGADDAAITAQLASARQAVRELAVAAFIDGGRNELAMSSLDPEQAMALSWRTSLISTQHSTSSEAVDNYVALRRSIEPDRVKAAAAIDQVDADLADATTAAIQAAAAERDAEAALAAATARATVQSAAPQVAQPVVAPTTTTTKPRRSSTTVAAARPRSTAPATAVATATSPRPVTPPQPVTVPSKPALPTPDPNDTSGLPATVPAGVGDTPSPEEANVLARIRACESRGNYAAVNPSGRFRGAYQFDVATWQALGGTGDPAAASPAAQDAVALRLLRMRGTAPWPTCRSR